MFTKRRSKLVIAGQPKQTKWRIWKGRHDASESVTADSTMISDGGLDEEQQQPKPAVDENVFDDLLLTAAAAAAASTDLEKAAEGEKAPRSNEAGGQPFDIFDPLPTMRSEDEDVNLLQAASTTVDEKAPNESSISDQEEGEQFSVKYITQLTTMTGSIEEDKSEEPFASPPPTAAPTKQISSSSNNDSDTADFVKLETVSVDSSVVGGGNLFATLLKEDSVVPSLDKAMSESPPPSPPPPSSSSSSSAKLQSPPVLSSGRLEEPLIDFPAPTSPPPPLPDLPNDNAMLEPEKKPNQLPGTFGRPLVLHSLAENAYGSDTFSAESAHSDEEPETYIGSRVAADSSYDTVMEKLEGVLPVKQRTVVEPTVAQPAADKTPTVGSMLLTISSDAEEPWISAKGVDPYLMELVHWQKPMHSGLALALALLLWSSLYFCNSVCVAAYAALLTMAVGCLLHLVEKFKCHGDQAEGVKTKLHKLLKCELPRHRIHAQVDVILEAVQYAIDSTQQALSGHPQELLRVLLIIALFYMVGSTFTLLELSLLGTLLAFSVPFVLKKYNKDIGLLMDKARVQLKPLADKLPFAAEALQKLSPKTKTG